MNLGFLGTGAITSAMVTGLCTGASDPYNIRLSPRNQAVAADLAERFLGVSIAASNQQLVDESDTVIVAVRPQIAADVLSELRFRPDHNVVSLVSGYSVARLSTLLAPATKITRAVPLPSMAQRRSPTAIYPRDAIAAQFFNSVGTAFAAGTEHEFDVFCTATAAMAAYFTFSDTVAGWLARNGIPSEESRDYVARLFAPLADLAIQTPGHSFQKLAADHATKGGTNEQVVRHLNEHAAFETFSDALDGILRRVTAGAR